MPSASGDAEKPLLRYVEPFVTVYKGQKIILLRDPLGYAEHPYPVSFYGAAILQMFDGRHGVEDIREEFRRATGQEVPAEEVELLIRELDDLGYLQTGKFAARKARVEKAFRDAPARAAAHLAAYTPDAKKLPPFLDAFFSDPRGPGTPPPRAVQPGPVRALLSPHIDFHRGGACYAHAYGALAAGCDADTFVVLGTAHQAPPHPFTATLKNYDTPLGPAVTDGEFIEELGKRYKGDLFADEYFHKDEHSIEFQAVCLKYLFRDRPFKVVPILVGGFHEHMRKGQDPLADPAIGGFVKALRKTLEGRKNVCLIGAVDLAHVGAKFGDREPVTEDLLKKIEEEDLGSLRHAEAVDASGFFKSIADVKDWRKICGLSAITTLLAATTATKGRLVKYDRFADLENHEVVSYTAMEFR